MSPLSVQYLRCEYLVNPLGIDVVKPRLSWVLISGERGARQIAYHILIASRQELLGENRADLWDTGQVTSNRTTHVIYEGKPLQSRMWCYWKVRVWDGKGNASDWSESATWSMGLLSAEDWKAEWIGGRPKKKQKGHLFFPKKVIDPSPYLGKNFSVDGKVRRAMVFVTALGEYELSLNGQRVGDHVLAPEWTAYWTRVQYQAFDVTNLVQVGENVLRATLADGWYAGNLGFFVRSRVYGADRCLLLQMVLELENGTTTEVYTGSDWQVWEDGPIRRADHYLGEIYDACKKLAGWDQPRFNATGWSPATVYKKKPIALVAQMNEPIRVVKEIHPVEVTQPKPGVFIFNMGQNMTGWCKITLSDAVCLPNATIRLRHGEMLELDGTLLTINLRTAKAIDEYIYNGYSAEYHPHFTYHGFQYVEVTGLKQAVTPPLDLITGCVVATGSPVVSSFESSDPSLNQLASNIFWTLLDNLISVPTDCPQRDERLGWMGDAQVFAQTSMFEMDLAAFYTKWMQDVRDAQFKDGRFSDFSPNPYMHGGFILKFRGSPAWADCGVTLPWDMFVNYADLRQLEVTFESAKRYVDQVRKKNPKLLWKRDVGVNYSDWLNGDKIQVAGYPKKGGAIPKVVLSTGFFAHSAELVSKMAARLGRTGDANSYAELARKIKDAFCAAFVDADGRIRGDTQSGYAIALHFDILPENLRPLAAQHLVKALARYDTRLSTGFNTTARMMLQLAQWGHADIAYQLLLSRRFPSWFYMIDQGATTMWERWDGFVKGRGFFNPRMNSFCHYSYGSVGEFLFRVVLGINPEEQHPGYEHVTIHPYPNHALAWVKGALNTIRGQITSEWSIDGDQLHYKLGIPANVTATVYLPANNAEEILEGDKSLQELEGIKVVGHEQGFIRLEVQSGTYNFLSKYSPK